MRTESLDFSPWGGGSLCESDETPELSPDKSTWPTFGTRQVKASGTLKFFHEPHTAQDTKLVPGWGANECF